MTVWLRQARSTDAGKLGDILWQNVESGLEIYDLFSEAEAIACCGRMIDQGWVTVAMSEDRVAAFLARDGEEIEALYVAQALAGKGVGAMLLEDAMARRDRLRLWVHPSNGGAQRFYRRLGFVEPQKSAQNPQGAAVRPPDSIREICFAMEWTRGPIE